MPFIWSVWNTHYEQTLSEVEAFLLSWRSIMTGLRLSFWPGSGSLSDESIAANHKYVAKKSTLKAVCVSVPVNITSSMPERQTLRLFMLCCSTMARFSLPSSSLCLFCRQESTLCSDLASFDLSRRPLLNLLRCPLLMFSKKKNLHWNQSAYLPLVATVT